MVAVIYARFSSDMQREESIDAQIRACSAYAAAHDMSIMRVYADEAISGKTADRRQYQAMLRDSQKKQFEVILAHKYDRIARNLGEHVNLEIKLQQYGVQLIAVAQDFGSSNESKIMKTLVWAMSEYYIDNLSDEVRKGHRENALKGLFNGGVAPFGYDIIDRKYVVNENEAYYVRRMFQCAAKREGYSELIREMNAKGITGKRGKPFRYSSIYEMLRNERYTGIYAYSVMEEEKRTKRRSKPNAIKIENALPTIIDKALFAEVQKIMDGRKQVGKKSKYLCSGLIYCRCGAKMHGLTTHRKGHEYRYYTCANRCGIGVISAEGLEKFAVSYLRALLAPHQRDEIVEAVNRYTVNENGRISRYNVDVRHQIAEKQKKIDGYMDTFSSGGLSKEIIQDIGQKIQALKDEIKILREAPPPVDFTVNQIKKWLDSLKDNPDEQAIRLLIERIDVKTKTDFNATSTLKSVLGENGCGGRT